MDPFSAGEQARAGLRALRRLGMFHRPWAPDLPLMEGTISGPGDPLLPAHAAVILRRWGERRMRRLAREILQPDLPGMFAAIVGGILRGGPAPGEATREQGHPWDSWLRRYEQLLCARGGSALLRKAGF